MKQMINALLKCNIESEGLLRVIESRDSKYARDVLSEKIEAFNTLYATMSRSYPVSVEDVPIETEETLIQSTEETPQSSADEPEACQYAKDNDTDIAAAPLQVSARQELDTTDNKTPIEENQTQTKASLTPESAQTEPNVSVAERDDSLRMDELLSRREAQDLRRAFTLNDKFRYRRELFDSNDALFADTLNTLSAMHSLDEALDYLYKDMGWDPEDDNVKDFVATITNHFNAIK